MLNLRILRANIKGLKLFSNSEFDINLLTDQRTSENNNASVDNLFNRIYVNKVLSITGRNASGKTTELNIFDFIYKVFLLGLPILTVPSSLSMIGKEFNVVIYFYEEVNKKIYKLESKLEKNDNKSTLRIVDETISEKNVKATTNSKNIFNDDFINIFQRSSLDMKEVLPNYSSIFRVITSNYSGKIPDIYNLSDYNNFNFMTHEDLGKYNLSKITPKILHYLDPTVESISSEVNSDDSEDGSNITYKIKFRHSKQEIAVNSLKIDRYLSSGTIKGLTIFKYVAIVLQIGGILILDEIENHFHKSIVNTIIDMFKDDEINKKNSTLIFSTHYPELLDLFDRNDDIFLSIRHDNEITFKRLSDIVKRNDIKRSEILNSGFISGTTPKYKSMMELIDNLKNNNDRSCE